MTPYLYDYCIFVTPPTFLLVTLTRVLAYFEFPLLPGLQIWCGDRAIGKVTSEKNFIKSVINQNQLRGVFYKTLSLID